MEKFSRFRDPGSGIQVFLPPVLPAGARDPLITIATPVALVLGLLRMLLILVTILLWSILALTLGMLSSGIQAGLTSTFGRLALFFVGYAWISPELVSLRSRGRAVSTRPVTYAPKKSDLIVANWSSWVEVLWLAITFAPTFALPVVDGPQYGASNVSGSTASASGRKGRTSGSGSAGSKSGSVGLHQRNSTGPTGDAADGQRRKIVGFRRVNWVTAARAVGQQPVVEDGKVECLPLDQVLANAPGPVVLFPEGVTSNNRALLRPAGCFPEPWRKAFKLTAALRLGGNSPRIFIASFKHGPPTPGSVSAVLSVPSSFAHPWPHIWQMCCSFSFQREFHARLLHPHESPTSATFIGDAAAAAMAREDPISDACLTIIASLSRLRRTDVGWEDKEAFMQIYRRR
ncbi:unnamed protein product [Tilletia controversa]|uniref:Phospholipid/glycerol acyltransferase domain-containing protein n=3 Tax=Tilletia TaxID=13289 RepID=A0A8X7MYW8_9BASI|nr:hypothetical protein CF336_g397 [Tilletia laevis]KAE8202853.1 hypothetical protein CF328_g1983 [Tilletia controversa]KAE8263495.1 hypothetical protein A4X03_0g1636 [Tilletia caries]KAE8207073.1 hypothetical protein CF335_g1420 [Tilletia laevis]KAE8253844.1 hypothetical protein A4X06_0g1188 [Tilletia controversa]